MPSEEEEYAFIQGRFFWDWRYPRMEPSTRASYEVTYLLHDQVFDIPLKASNAGGLCNLDTY